MVAGGPSEPGSGGWRKSGSPGPKQQGRRRAQGARRGRSSRSTPEPKTRRDGRPTKAPAGWGCGRADEPREPEGAQLPGHAGPGAGPAGHGRRKGRRSLSAGEDSRPAGVGVVMVNMCTAESRPRLQGRRPRGADPKLAGEGWGERAAPGRRARPPEEPQQAGVRRSRPGDEAPDSD